MHPTSGGESKPPEAAPAIKVPMPSGEWGATGGGKPNLEGGFNQPPGAHGDSVGRVLMARTVAILYSAVGSAQQAEVSADPERHAVEQMVIANAALAAGAEILALALQGVRYSVYDPDQEYGEGRGERARFRMACHGSMRGTRLSESLEERFPNWFAQLDETYYFDRERADRHLSREQFLTDVMGVPTSPLDPTIDPITLKKALKTTTKRRVENRAKRPQNKD